MTNCIVLIGSSAERARFFYDMSKPSPTRKMILIGQLSLPPVFRNLKILKIETRNIFYGNWISKKGRYILDLCIIVHDLTLRLKFFCR